MSLLIVNDRYTHFMSITTVFFAVVMLLLFSSCSKKEQPMGAAILNRDSLPVLKTFDVNSLISDSGVIRYRIIAKEWLVYDKKNPSYWAFEKGVYLEKFDLSSNVDASIVADTAYYYDKQRLWKLIGNVDIKNTRNERFTTELMYWDEVKRKIYSDKFIRIQQPDRIITGHGFESNQQMSVYSIHKPEGIFYVKDDSFSKTSADTTTNK